MRYTHANIIAITVLESLRPHCEVANSAGSVRRQRYEVNDIEVCCLPKIVTVDLFNTEKQRSQAFIDAVNNLGNVVSGKPKEGRWVKIELPAGIKLDLFIPQPHDYYRIYAIRTGSKDYAHQVIAKAWERLGWAGTPDGLRRQNDCIENTDTNTGKRTWKCVSQNPTLPPVWKSEQEFYNWLNIPWVEPRLREITTPSYNQFLKQ